MGKRLEHPADRPENETADRSYSAVAETREACFKLIGFYGPKVRKPKHPKRGRR